MRMDIEMIMTKQHSLNILIKMILIRNKKMTLFKLINLTFNQNHLNQENKIKILVFYKIFKILKMIKKEIKILIMQIN